MIAFAHRTPCWRPWLLRGLWRLPDAMAGGVLLSFDDGPSESSLRVAAVLEEHGVRGFFFLLAEGLPAAGESHPGPEAKRRAAIARELVRRGHLLGLHGLEHRRAFWRAPAALKADWREAGERIEAASGFRPRHARPPYGSWAPWLNGLPRRLGLRLVLWSVDPVDYAARDAEAIVAASLSRLRAGDILLLHCSGPNEARTLAALPGLLAGLQARGLAVVDPNGLLEGADA